MCVLRESLRRGSNNNNNYRHHKLCTLKVFVFISFRLVTSILLFFKGAIETNSCCDRKGLSSHENRNDANKNKNRAFSSTRDDTLKGGC